MISISADKIVYGETNRIIHHPLYGRYTSNNGVDIKQHQLSFSGGDLFTEPIITDINFFYLHIDPGSRKRVGIYPEEKGEILSKLIFPSTSWWIGLDAHVIQRVGITEELMIISSIPGLSVYEKPFYRIDNSQLEYFVSHNWKLALPGINIEGYLLPEDGRQYLITWNRELRTPQLISDVLDICPIAFFSFPAEHDEIVLATKKLRLDDITKLIFSDLHNDDGTI